MNFIFMKEIATAIQTNELRCLLINKNPYTWVLRRWRKIKQSPAWTGDMVDPRKRKRSFEILINMLRES